MLDPNNPLLLEVGIVILPKSPVLLFVVLVGLPKSPPLGGGFDGFPNKPPLVYGFNGFEKSPPVEAFGVLPKSPVLLEFPKSGVFSFLL